MIVDEIFIITELHYGDLIFLAALLVIVDFSIAIIKELAAFSDFVFKRRSFILESNSHFSDFSIDH